MLTIKKIFLLLLQISIFKACFNITLLTLKESLLRIIIKI